MEIKNKKEKIYLEIISPRVEQNKYHLQYCKLRNFYVANIPKEKFPYYKFKSYDKKIYFLFKEGNKDCIDPNYQIVSLNKKEKLFCKMIDLNSFEELEKVHHSILHRRKVLFEFNNWRRIFF